MRSWQLGLLVVIAVARPATADDARVAETTAAPPTPPLDLRITLSSFLFRETGADAAARTDQGAVLQNASPVRRYFGDLRFELTGSGVTLDARVRQTTSQRYQAGAGGGGEYELRTLAYRLGSPTTALVIGRQYIPVVGSTRIDGLALSRQLSTSWAATLFGGTFPELGSRSIDTDYVRLRNEDGSQGARILPVAGGLGVAYQKPDYHGDVGVAGVYVPQDIPNATTLEKSRVFATSTGYWRPAAALDVYHFALLDVAGANRVGLTNGSIGVDLRPVATVQLTASVHHVSTDLLSITARNLLADPDPSAIGVVQNNIAVVRVSQDVARAAASLALARQRFELSVSGGLRNRPEVAVELADGTGAVAFPATRSADATFMVLDRRSLGGVRASIAGTLTFPIGNQVPNRARGTIVRIAAGRTFAAQRGQLEVDVMGERIRDVDRSGGACMTSTNVFACYGNSNTIAAQAGMLASWRLGREWLVLGDVHVGYQDIRSMGIDGETTWPHVYSITAFVRAQWRYR